MFWLSSLQNITKMLMFQNLTSNHVFQSYAERICEIFIAIQAILKCLKSKMMKFFIKLWNQLCVFFFFSCDYFFFWHSFAKFTCQLSINFIACDLPVTVNVSSHCSIHKFWKFKWNLNEFGHFSTHKSMKLCRSKKYTQQSSTICESRVEIEFTKLRFAIKVHQFHSIWGFVCFFFISFIPGK